ncbi:MAG: glycosyltransferase [Candidatus Falkowbacteria bacterium]|nr:glycosyltransferase [Candidatus Falkowbacteria bacterium]
MIKFSFIIPVKAINDYIREAVPKVLEINRDDYEIIIYPDKIDSDFFALKTKQIATGHVGPAAKRSLAIKDAQGEILIFIDDDAYPENNFLEVLESNFNDINIKAVGGPAITPKNDSFWQKVSGAVFLSPLAGGNPERYMPVGKKRPVNDWPSVNFSIRKNVFTELNGFASEFWPGEDTKLCLDLIKKYPNGLIYDPALIAYHHRRAGLAKHLKQICGYGLHRGFFAKKYPETSGKVTFCKLNFFYFIPSLFLLFVISGGVASFFNKIVLELYVLGWIIYLIALIKAIFDISRYEKNLPVALNAVYYIFLTHLVYGYNFLKGFIFIRNLKSKLR